ncbi:hypothetical protein SK128_018909 [Halocaridina rubra]|uniref:Cuticle protein n=1 Tax=Halocaridina rubra TaxID=373956 RepID=A0AAN9A108_HALRR
MNKLIVLACVVMVSMVAGDHQPPGYAYDAPAVPLLGPPLPQGPYSPPRHPRPLPYGTLGHQAAPLHPDEEPAHYNYEYQVHDDISGAHYGHAQSRQGLLTEGEYFVHLPDGRIQRVTYYADETGYHATVTYEGEAVFPPAPFGQQHVLPVPRPSYGIPKPTAPVPIGPVPAAVAPTLHRPIPGTLAPAVPRPIPGTLAPAVPRPIPGAFNPAAPRPVPVAVAPFR